ncbi:MAG: thiamine pyrophosphate-binding protein [Planctomycetaceae bacterium]|nr:thiamine pyrophosphate-binding protein [Planctomycetaceae bacterium]
MARTGGDVLLECLKAQGVRAVFGMPGTQNIALYDAFHRSGDGLPHYLIRHEQGATMLANGFARASGEVAAAFTVPGPGASNAATGIVDASTDCVPVLLVVGGYDRAIAGRDRTKLFHGLDQEAFFRPIVRYFGRPENVQAIPGVVNAAFQAMFAGRPGPAVIELAPDVAAELAPAGLVPGSCVARVLEAPVQRQEILRAAARIREMRRPVLLVGVDCVAARAADEVRRLAERLEAPVLYGRLGKGVLSDEHPLVAGFTRSKLSNDLLRQADGLIAVGTRLTQIDTLGWSLPLPANIVQLDRDRRELGREAPITAGVSGGLRSALFELSEQLDWMGPNLDPEWSIAAGTAHTAWVTKPPIPVLSQIRQALPRDGLVSIDVTSTGYSCFDRFPVYGPRSLIYPCHSVTLGFAFPAAIGAKLAQPERPVVSLSGDGGFLMGCFELATAVEYEVGVVAVVVRDNCLTAIKGSQQQAFAGRTVDVDMQTPDFAALARSFGATGVTTERVDELPSLIEAGLLRRGPTVIEVRMPERSDELISVIPWLHGE